MPGSDLICPNPCDYFLLYLLNLKGKGEAIIALALS